MVCLTYCHACQFGMHSEHIKDFDPAPPGVMGGAQCPCEGECVEKNKQPPISEPQKIDEFMTTSWEEFFKLTRGIQ